MTTPTWHREQGLSISRPGGSPPWKTLFAGARRLAVILAIHLALAGGLSLRSAPVSDEAAHLAAGLYSIRTGRFDRYPVNPPLVKVVAALPVHAMGPVVAPAQASSLTLGARPEWSAGIAFVRANAPEVRRYFPAARWACIPFTVLGAVVCWLWAGRLYGDRGAGIAAALWCFCPNVLAWTGTICPDVPAAALGISAAYAFWLWLCEPTWYRALVAGSALGFAQLAKMTWLVLFGIWPLVWMIAAACLLKGCCQVRPRPRLVHLLGMLLLGLLVLNMGYAFRGTLRPLGDYVFVSKTLAGDNSLVCGGEGGNRFAEGPLAVVPVPLPGEYLAGADLQKVDFERGLRSYLCGEWSDDGWWYWYAVAACVKVPIGVGILACLALGASLRRSVAVAPYARIEAGMDGRGRLMAEVILLVTFVAVGCLVSSQTGVNRHFRYVLPALPFLFVLIARVAEYKHIALKCAAAGALLWAVASSLSVYPHSMSYFNEIVGGPAGGHRFLLDSNLDWGQDTFELAAWCNSRHDISALRVFLRNAYSADLLEAECNRLDRANSGRIKIMNLEREEFEDEWRRPGWMAVSVHKLHEDARLRESVTGLTPVASIGYSILIYNVTGGDGLGGLTDGT